MSPQGPKAGACFCRHRGAKLKLVLDDYKLHAGRAVHWIFVGPSGRRDRPDAGGVLRAYDRCSRRPRTNVKTIANTYFLAGTSDHPHGFFYRCVQACERVSA